MSRSLVLGNGNILVCMDQFGQLREFYFHYVGLENQMYKGCVARIGVWVDGQFSWLSDSKWNMVVDYKYETLVSSIVAVNRDMEIELTMSDIVYNEKNIFVRNIKVKNMAQRARDIKVFLGHEFHIYENKVGDTGYFDPSDNTIVHYKGRRVMVLGGENDGSSFDQYSIGVFGIEGKAGSFMDAEDGELSGNAVEHGPVDSVIRFQHTVESQHEWQFSYWITIDKSLQAAKELHAYVLNKTSSHLIKTTHDFWRAWVNKTDIIFFDLDRRIVDLFKKSLLIIRTHIDNTGAIIASGDADMLQHGKDTYSYVWPRDASFISMAMDDAGYYESIHDFFEFANQVISSEGYFYHKYRSDKSVGSSWHPWVVDGQERLPIQEDETALVIYALWNHYNHTKDLEFVESIYNSLVKKAANFMVGFREGTTKLPAQSYDLWEMKNGISTFTASSVFAALQAASEFAKLLGKDKDSKDYINAAEEIKAAIVKYLWNEEDGYFYKHIEVHEGDILHDKIIDASSIYGVFKFGVLPIDDPKVIKSIETLKNRLWCNSKTGGVARFENDIYYQQNPFVPGNPWFITTLWLAQYKIASAKNTQELEGVLVHLRWVVDCALPSGVLSEQLDPHSGIQLSASPLIWSHAEFVTTVLLYLKKLKLLKNEK